ncbi:MAG: acyltransferase family protein [Janthinobacterium lividum]
MQNSSARNYSLDAARGILMMLGVVLHASNIYATGDSWLVKDSERSQAFEAISDAIHVFRMPAFFWISGYFCALTFEKNGADGLLRKRLPRLLIPLFSTWITLNVAQELFSASVEGKSMVAAILDGIPLYHLWFLVDLILFIGFAAALLPRLARFGSWGKRLETLPLWLMFPALALLSEAASVAARATGVAYDSVLGLTTLYRLAEHLPYFVAGIFMYAHPGARLTFLRTPVLLLVATLPLALYAHEYTRGQGFVIGEFAVFIEAVMVWLSVAAVLRIFHDLVQRDSSVTRFMSDSAYSVYLFHHILVVVLGSALLNYRMGPWPEFLIVCGTSLVVSALIHDLFIRRNRVAHMLFNGK